MPYPEDMATTINVHTYYTHKLAWEKMQRHERKLQKPRPKVHGPALLMVLALLLTAWGSPLGLLIVAARGVVQFLQHCRRRTRKFFRALQGQPLDLEDLAALRAR